jgi:hypothetical protein
MPPARITAEVEAKAQEAGSKPAKQVATTAKTAATATATATATIVESTATIVESTATSTNLATVQCSTEGLLSLHPLHYSSCCQIMLEAQGYFKITLDFNI